MLYIVDLNTNKHIDHKIELNRGLTSHWTATVISVTYVNVHSRQVHKLLSQYTHRNCTLYSKHTDYDSRFTFDVPWRQHAG